jgi:hypothetical protein
MDGRTELELPLRTAVDRIDSIDSAGVFGDWKPWRGAAEMLDPMLIPAKTMTETNTQTPNTFTVPFCLRGVPSPCPKAIAMRPSNHLALFATIGRVANISSGPREAVAGS